MSQDDISLLIDAAKEAGKIALPFWRNAPKAWEKEAGAGPVCEADLAVDAMLKEFLLTARPDYGWLSEETEDCAERLTKDRVFIIDPIDGTRSYLQGDNTWAHSLAIAEKGKIISAVVYLPVKDYLYTAQKGGGAFLNGERLSVGEQSELPGASVLAAKPNFQEKFWKSEVPAFKKSFRPSLAYRLALVAQGRFDAMLTLRPTWEWDVAAGVLLMEEAGGLAYTPQGTPPVFNSPDANMTSLIASNKSLTPKILEQLSCDILI